MSNEKEKKLSPLAKELNKALLEAPEDLVKIGILCTIFAFCSIANHIGVIKTRKDLKK